MTLATVGTLTSYDLSDSSQRHRQIDHTQNGIWWTRLDNVSTGSGVNFFYSNAALTTWTAGMTLTSAAGNVTNATFFIDKEDFMHVIYTIDGAARQRLRYRRGTPNAGRTNYTWGTEYDPVTTVADTGISATGFTYGIDVIAVPDGGTGYHIFIPFTYFDYNASGNYWSYLARGTVNSSGVYTYQQLFSNSSSSAPHYASLDFKHTLADDKAGQTASADVYWVDQPIAYGYFARHCVLTYSGGTYTQGSTSNVGDGSRWASTYSPPSVYYDGTRIVVAWEDADDFSSALIAQITPGGGQGYLTVPAINDGNVYTWNVAYDLQGNVHLLAVGSTSQDLKRCVYNRAAGTWGSWTTFYTGSLGSRAAHMPRGEAAATIGIPVLFKDTTPTPDVIYTDVILPPAPPPLVAQGWGLPITATPVPLGVTFDAVSEDPAVGYRNTTGNSWTHTPVGTPKGVLIFVIRSGTAANDVSALTYGGVPVPVVPGGLAVDTLGERGMSQAYYLGSGVPPGPQSVSVTYAADLHYTVVITLAAGIDTRVHFPSVQTAQEDGALAEVNLDDGSPGTSSLRFAGGHSGLATFPSAGANSTLVAVNDSGLSVSAGVCRETTPGQGVRPVGVSGTSDDRAVVYLAIREGLALQTVRPDGTTAEDHSYNGPTMHQTLSDEDSSTEVYGLGNDSYGTLGNAVDPGVNTDHVLRLCWYRSSGTGIPSAQLWQGNPLSGGTLIKDVSPALGSAGAFEQFYPLDPSTEAALITNYNDLWWLLEKSGGTSTWTIAEYRLDVPPVA